MSETLSDVKPVRIVVLGVGRWGTHLVRNFWKHPDAQLVAVIDPHPEHLAAIRAQFNLNTDVVLATDWELVRDRIDIDAVVVATPAATHYSLIRDALQQGYHVLAEKPLTLDVAECIQLYRFAQQQHRQLMVDHTYLFHPAVEGGKSVVQSGQLGELRYGYAARTNLGPVRQDVDALWDLAIHDIAIFNTWLSALPIEVQATGRVWLRREGQAGEQGSGGAGERGSRGAGEQGSGGAGEQGSRGAGEQTSAILPSQGLADWVQVTLTYPTGFQALIHLCWLNPDKQRRLGVVGSQGTLIFDEMQPNAPLTLQHGSFEQNGDFFTPIGQRCEVLDIPAEEPLGLVCDRFLKSVRYNQPSPLSSGWVGAQLVQILCCLSQSMQQGGCPITVPPLPNQSLETED